MTQPSLNQTFDTSLIDLKDEDQDFDQVLAGSFSTTDTDTSDYEQKARATISAMEARQKQSSAEHTPKAQNTAQFTQAMGSADTDLRQEAVSPSASSAAKSNLSSKRPMRYLCTEKAYDEWAEVYDNDGNMLQSVDDDELATMLPEMLGLVTQEFPSELTILDVGCGTGRNTLKLLTYQWPSNCKISLTGLELSAGMLGVAEKKLRPLEATTPNTTLGLVQADVFGSDQKPASYPSNADALISTLVLEHVGLNLYFGELARLLRPGGYALITNMHQEMGLISQAGFVASDGTKVRGTSWAHSTADSRKVAEEAGFEVVGVIKERRMEESMIGSVASDRGKKWIGIQVWYGMILRKRVRI